MKKVCNLISQECFSLVRCSANVFAYGQKEKIYIELKNLFDKYIEVPVKEYDTIFESSENLEDSKYIVKTVKDSFLNFEKFVSVTNPVRVTKAKILLTKANALRMGKYKNKS